MQRQAWLAMLVFSIILFAQANPLHTATSEVAMPASIQDGRYDYLQHTLILPNGRVLYPGQAGRLAAWKDLELKLVNVSVKKDAPPIQTVVGNHTIILQTAEHVIPAGKVTFADVERTPSAASGLTGATREYWLIKFRNYPGRPEMVLAHAIQAVVTGDPRRARQELLQLAQRWKMPTR